MRRAPALAALSRDHHHALVIARTLVRATGATAAGAEKNAMDFLARHELAHFAVEESVLLPFLLAQGPGEELAERMLADHAFLREAVRRLGHSDAPRDLEILHEIGRRLRGHVQMEERELFPYLERVLSPAELEQIGARIEASEQRTAHREREH